MRVPTYWWTTRPNFGDAIGPCLFAHFSGISAEWTAPERASLIGAGFVLDVLPEKGWTGIVAGSGTLHPEIRIDLSDATVLGLRGYLTVTKIDGLRGNYVLGDPGLLAEELVVTTRKTHDLGVVPHWSDPDLPDRFAYLNPFVIDPRGAPLEVVKAIGSCEKIVASSLHGIIVADAFGIPRRAEVAANLMNSPYEGGIYKFEDYASVIGQPIEFGKLQTPPRARIEAIQAELFDMYRSLLKLVTS